MNTLASSTTRQYTRILYCNVCKGFDKVLSVFVCLVSTFPYNVSVHTVYLCAMIPSILWTGLKLRAPVRPRARYDPRAPPPPHILANLYFLNP